MFSLEGCKRLLELEKPVLFQFLIWEVRNFSSLKFVLVQWFNQCRLATAFKKDIRYQQNSETFAFTLIELSNLNFFRADYSISFRFLVSIIILRYWLFKNILFWRDDISSSYINILQSVSGAWECSRPHVSHAAAAAAARQETGSQHPPPLPLLPSPGITQ